LRAVGHPERVSHLVLHGGYARAPFADGRLLASLIPGARFARLESNNRRAPRPSPRGSGGVTECARSLSATEPPTRCSPR
jgi:hypothetical protein